MGFLVDISNNNGLVAGTAAIDEPGCLGVYAKATEGLSFEDTLYPKFRTHAQMRDKAFGAYTFLHPGLDGAQQAHYFIAYAKPLPNDLQPVVDTETLAQGGWAQCAKTTLDALHALRKLEFDPVGYASSSFVQELVRYEPLLKSFDWWYADYASKLWSIPGVRGVLWQWTDKQAVGRGRFHVDGDKLLVRDLSALRIAKVKKPVYPPKPKPKPMPKKKPALVTVTGPKGGLITKRLLAQVLPLAQGLLARFKKISLTR